MALYRKNSNNELELYDSPWVANELYPVGYVYVQFPGTDAPEALGLPGTWQNISSNWAGRFFRAAGGTAAAFGSCQDFATDYSSLSISHSNNSPVHCHCFVMCCAITSSPGFGSSASCPVYCTCTKASCNAGAHTHTVSFTNTTETRPANYTIRIWKRTA